MSAPYRCKTGDLVMLIHSRTPARLGRIGVIVSATADVAASTFSAPDELSEVLKRDWVVDFQGAPDVSVRDGRTVVTNRMACHDQALLPLCGHSEGLECDAALTAGGA